MPSPKKRLYDYQSRSDITYLNDSVSRSIKVAPNVIRNVRVENPRALQRQINIVTVRSPKHDFSSESGDDFEQHYSAYNNKWQIDIPVNSASDIEYDSHIVHTTRSSQNSPVKLIKTPSSISGGKEDKQYDKLVKNFAKLHNSNKQHLTEAHNERFELENKIKMLKTENAALMLKVQPLKDQNQAKDEALAGIVGLLGDTKLENQRLKKEMEDLKIELHTNRKLNMDSIQREDVHTKDKDSLLMCLNVLNSQLDELTPAQAELVQKNRSLEGHNIMLKNQLKVLTETKAAVDNDLLNVSIRLANEIEATAKIRAQTTELQTELKLSKESNKTQYLELIDLRKKLQMFDQAFKRSGLSDSGAGSSLSL